ncbi:MAG TPA: hypothetical protein VM755_22495 [Stellaceae bacterium]|nr:hypothetical protein [Stellaceae bacterium]
MPSIRRFEERASADYLESKIYGVLQWSQRIATAPRPRRPRI